MLLAFRSRQTPKISLKEGVTRIQFPAGVNAFSVATMTTRYRTDRMSAHSIISISRIDAIGQPGQLKKEWISSEHESRLF